MKRIIAILLLLSLIASPSYAVNFIEKILYKEDVIEIYNAKVLVVPITGEVKYIWCGNPQNGYWLPVERKGEEAISDTL